MLLYYQKIIEHIDHYNREVIDYTVSKKIGTELVKRAWGNTFA